MSLHSRKTKHLKKKSSISFNQLKGLDESDGDKHQDEQDKHDQQDPKTKQKDQLLSTLNQMEVSISKMMQLDTLGLSKRLSLGK